MTQRGNRIDMRRAKRRDERRQQRHRRQQHRPGQENHRIGRADFVQQILQRGRERPRSGRTGTDSPQPKVNTHREVPEREKRKAERKEQYAASMTKAAGPRRCTQQRMGTERRPVPASRRAHRADKSRSLFPGAHAALHLLPAVVDDALYAPAAPHHPTALLPHCTSPYAP